jgi:uncharacterized coiled-coil protein SlyX
MNDDLVRRLRTSWDADRSIISQTDNWMKERQEAADRIEELEAQLAKAVDAIDGLLAVLPDDEGPEIDYARTTLAELSSVSCANSKGEK